MKRSILNPLRLLLVLALAPWVAPAQITLSPPGQISYQGFLTDASGIPLATNAPRNYIVNFRIYDGSTGGNLLWGEQQVVTVDRGYLSVVLGNGASITNTPFTNDLTGVFSGTSASDRYIGMTLPELFPQGVSPSEIVPRLQLLASSYAFLARNATALVSPNGSNLVTAAGGQLTVNGTISGNGSGLTNLAAASLTNTMSLAQLPASVVTNGASGVNLNGTLSGNGAGLTNIPVAAVVPPPLGMVLIPAGSFTMGNLSGDTDINDAPLTTTYVSAFYMDVNMVTLSQWLSVYFWATNHGYSFTNSGGGKAANHPVLGVNWYDCAKWCNARSEQAGRMPVYYTDPMLTNVYRTGQIDITNGCVKWVAKGYRLPTETEFEKAARGGTTNRFPWGDVVNQNLANYYGNTSSYAYDLGPNGYNPVGAIGGAPYTSPVGSFAPNGYGLFDMAGNTFEWCWDWYMYSYHYAGGSNPHGYPTIGQYRVFRGGANWFNADRLRCGMRGGDAAGQPDGGVRCVMGL